MTQKLATQLRWLIAIRLVVITSVVLPYFLLQLVRRGGAPDHSALYLLAGVSYGANLVYIALLRLLSGRLPLQAQLQFLGDLVLVSALVYYFGGVASPFSILYLIVIAVASTLLRRRTGVATATLAWLFYAGVALSLHLGWLPPSPGLEGNALQTPRLVYNLMIHLFGFYAVAFLTSYLAQSASRAEQQLEEKEVVLADLRIVHRDVIESISSGLMTTDLSGTVITLNRAGQEILETTEEEAVGHPVFATGLLSPERWPPLARGAPAPLRDEVVRPAGGGPQYVGFSASPLTDGDGRQTGFIVIFQDLTEKRRLEEELKVKDRMAAVGELAAGIAHEIGNPLAAISGSVQMLSSSLPEDSSRRQLLAIILKESQRLDRTVKGFLRFARPKERVSVRFDIAALLAENCELLSNSAELSPTHRLELAIEPGPVFLLADPDQVSQIFWNLARNALRAMPNGGTLRIEGRPADGFYHLVFADDGRGMSAHERGRLFHPFQSFFDDGTGIGMAIVYRIVEEHRGRVAVDTIPGRGTAIQVSLPIGAAAVGADAPVEIG